MPRKLRMRPLVILLPLLTASLTSAGELTFEDRVRAQKAIERVYYSHQIGSSKSFSEAVPRDVLETKVQNYLRQSVALSAFYHSPITRGALRREVERMARETRLPDRLKELYEALGNDPFLVEECLVRPVIADRLLRSFFASDERIHATARGEADSIRARLARRELDPLQDSPRRHVVQFAPIAQSSGEEEVASTADGEMLVRIDPADLNARIRATLTGRHDSAQFSEEPEAFVVRSVIEAGPDRVREAVYSVPKVTWDAWWSANAARFDGPDGFEKRGNHLELPEPRATALGPCDGVNRWEPSAFYSVPRPRHGHASVWTGAEMIVWGGVSTSSGLALHDGARYDPILDHWVPISAALPIPWRAGHTAIWSGTEMILYGGGGGSIYYGDGARYDPIRDEWRTVQSLDPGRTEHSAVWTGNSMLVWGGRNGNVSLGGAIYDPVTDTWRDMSETNEPTRRFAHAAVWTGAAMMVWGGYAGDSGLYDPIGDRWKVVSTDGMPQAYSAYPTAVWTGSQVVVWGGYMDAVVNTGGRYDPLSDTWLPMSITNAPVNRHQYNAVWTGSRMIVWGGAHDYNVGLRSGGQYAPYLDTWSPTSLSNAPSGRYDAGAVWTGDRMVVWGGAGTGVQASGGRYDPSSDTWTPTSTGSGPSARKNETGVWTGAAWLIWGGYSGSDPVASGGGYDPTTNTWTQTATENAPFPRGGHTAVWTGSEMIVWGGVFVSFPLNSGGAYEPISNTWRPTSSIGAPDPWPGHLAVWTGSSMLIWGPLQVGAKYDPSNDSWSPMSSIGAPQPRRRFDMPAFWTGEEMLVWGGVGGVELLNSGALYDPELDSWRSTSLVGAPVPGNNGFIGAWVGNRMFAWRNGQTPTFTESGGLYDPSTDTWAPVAHSGRYAINSHPSAVWTGHHLLFWYGGQVMRFDPVANTWMPLPQSNPPSSRYGHLAVWIGHSMLVWGGTNGPTQAFPLYDPGGSYRPDDSPDSDNDRFTSCRDCDDDNPDAYFDPQVVSAIHVSHEWDGTTLFWQQQIIDATTRYDVHSGPLAESASTSLGGTTCLFSIASNVVGDGRPDPDVGAGIWYLVRARSACGTTTFGSLVRDGTIAACP